MPKIKSNRAAGKRFKKTKRGHLKRSMAYGSHLLTGKTSKRRRKLRKASVLCPSDEARIKHLLPY